jgi:hypothetical protein
LLINPIGVVSDCGNDGLNLRQFAQKRREFILSIFPDECSPLNLPELLDRVINVSRIELRGMVTTLG